MNHQGRQWCWTLLITALLPMIGASSTIAQCETAQLSEDDHGNFFGFSVSIEGDLCVIGDYSAFDSLGAAFVYRQGAGGLEDWQQEAILMAPKPFVDDQFAQAVAVGNGVIIIGAPNSATPEFHAGAAYIFRYHKALQQWIYEEMLVPADGDFGDNFGWSVAVNGNILLVGAPSDENQGAAQSGSAYVFRYDGSRWTEEARLTDPDGQTFDLFGVSTSICDDVALVGAHGTDNKEGTTGSAFVFRFDGKEWVLEAELSAFDTMYSERFGYAVSLARNLAVVGAYWDNNIGIDDGSAYVYRFDRNTATWLDESKLTASDAEALDWFGWSVSIGQKGKWIVVGAVDESTMGFEAGAAYLFESTPHGWQQVKKLTASDGGALDYFGAAVSVDGEAALIGAPGPSQNPGTVYVFDFDPATADLDCDGMVGAADLLILLTGWGPCEDCDHCPADLDQDCSVGASDLLILLVNWG